MFLEYINQNSTLSNLEFKEEWSFVIKIFKSKKTLPFFTNTEVMVGAFKKKQKTSP